LAEEYLIKPGDSLGVNVLGEPDLTKRVVVDPQGGITLPMINQVVVSGLTTNQAAQEITSRLKQFFKNPVVSIELLESGKLQVTVSGEVKNPGLYSLTGGARLMDVITAAGGYTPSADLSKVKITRAGDVGSSTIDLSKFLLSGDAGANPAVGSGDTIVIPSLGPAAIGTVTILGAVRQSGRQSITQGTTLREAVMMAGGPTEFADISNITLRRDGSSEPVILNYASGDPESNPELKPGDVIYVGAMEQLGTYTIQGAVGSPGRFDLKGKTSITEAIAIAGGVRDRAKLGDVRILRASGDTLQANVSEIMAGRNQNISIQDGDSIFVPAGGQRPDFLRVLSLAVSIAWLVSGH
jgi:protein involved in polysaccharide export with SLBB domain